MMNCLSPVLLALLPAVLAPMDEDLVLQASKAEARREFAAARDFYLRALEDVYTDAVLKGRLAGRADDARLAHLALRGAGRAVTLSPFRHRGVLLTDGRSVDPLSADGHTLLLSVPDRPGQTERVAWREVEGRSLDGTLMRAELDHEGLLGAAVIAFREDRPAIGEARLRDALQAGVRDPVLWAILGRARGEVPPPDGYVWSPAHGRWITRRQQFSDADLERLALLSQAIETGTHTERTAAFDDLIEEGIDAVEPLAASLHRLVANVENRIRESSAGGRVAALAEQRRRLDVAREAALGLIFDEQRYFYPYRPPEVAPETARNYWPVQQEVDELRRAVEEIWGDTLRVPVSGAFRDMATEYRWALDHLRQLGETVEPAPGLAWVLAVGVSTRSLTLASFAWNAEEAGRIRHNGRVAIHNAAVETTAKSDEKRQVGITNAYRIMMGRRALALVEPLQQAARKHSAEMANLGYFAHTSPTPGLESPGQRMAAEGYTAGISENIYRGGGAASAHASWLTSSGHHRNILMEGHREMGSGAVGGTWTQNFGMGRVSMKDPAWPLQ